MSYSSTNGTFAYTITNNTSYVVEPLDYDIILSAFNRWDNIMTIDSRFGSLNNPYTITISFIIDTLDAGVLGGASITTSSYVDTYTYGNVVPLTADITMNNTYIGNMKTTVRNDGYTSYYHVLLHEIGHILGIGSFWYLTGCPKTGYTENGTTKHYYTGTNAFREYKLHFGNNTFVGVPIEDDGGAGTSGVHPEEGPEGGISADNRYINGILHPGLDTELMTGWLDSSPVSTPLSRITLGFLEDMGYTVNYNLADVYIMSWLQETEANNLERTYIQGFLDVSGGNMINRHGNLSILQGTMDVSGGVAFNSRLDVGGDVSLCSTGGTRVDICGNLFAQYDTANPSIPADAIIGLGNVTPNFTGPVKFGDKVGINTTVIPGASDAALDVSGNINFSGDLLKGGVAFVSGATDLSGLSDVIVGGPNFTNSMLIGTTHTGTLSSASSNTGIGGKVLYNLTSSIRNTAIGYYSCYNIRGGNGHNTAIGMQSLTTNQTGAHNTAIGAWALDKNLDNYNTALGSNSGGKNTTGMLNLFLGYNTGQSNITGSYNTFIGPQSNTQTSDLSGSTAIGYRAEITASDQIMLGRTGDHAPSVYMPGPRVDICGNLYAQYDIVTPTIPAGAIIGGVGSNEFTGDVTMDDNLSVSGTISSVLDASFNAQLYGNTITDGTATLTGGALSGITSIGAESAAFSATTGSSSTITGALTIGGGVGIAGALYVGGDLSWNPVNITNDSIPQSAIIGGVGSNHFTGDVSMNNNLEVVEHITINPIKVIVDVSGIQHLDQSLKFTIPNSMTALKYFCTSHSNMIGDFILASSPTETDKTYYVRMVATDPQNTAPYYLFSETPNGTALNDTAAIGSGLQLTLYKGNTYTFIKTDTSHPFMVGDSWKVTTGIKLESTGDGAVTASEYTNPYPLHVNGMVNIENNLNVARTLTVAGPIRQW
jgi:hypothetical protein